MTRCVKAINEANLASDHLKKIYPNQTLQQLNKEDETAISQLSANRLTSNVTSSYHRDHGSLADSLLQIAKNLKPAKLNDETPPKIIDQLAMLYDSAATAYTIAAEGTSPKKDVTAKLAEIKKLKEELP